MKIVFFGNGLFSLKPLKSLHNSSHTLSLVVSNKPIKRGRGLKLKENSISLYCQMKNIDLFQTTNANKNEHLYKELKEINADLFIVVEYKYLSPKIFNLPKNGTINLHASILPSYRGAAPIQRALMNGDNQIGLTSFFIKEKIDSGDILSTLKVDIDDKITYGVCYDMLSNLSENFLINCIDSIKKKKSKKQSIDKQSLAPKIS